jgi:hypothetical protein
MGLLTEGTFAGLGLGQSDALMVEQMRKNIEENWSKTGLLDGLEEGSSLRTNIAVLFENTAKYLMEATSSDASGSFETIAFPLIRRTFTKLLANDIVTVQALNLPVGKIFFYKPLISTRNANGDFQNHSAMQGAYANEPSFTTANTRNNTVGFDTKSLYDLNYATKYNDWGDSLFDRSKSNYRVRTSGLVPAISFDPTETNAITTSYKIAAITGFSTANRGTLVGPSGVEMDTEEFLKGMIITCNTTLNSVESTAVIPAGDPVPFTILTLKWGEQIVSPTGEILLRLDLGNPSPTGGFSTYSGATALTQFTAVWREYTINEADAEMAEVSFDLADVTIVVGDARKMRANWTPEQAMDVNRFQGIDAEAELTNMLSEQIANEIDSEILRDLDKQPAWVNRWDYNGPRRQTNTYFGVQKDWNQTLVEVINTIDAQIYKSTLEGGANYLVVSPEVATVFRNMEFFHMANGQTEEIKYNMGIEKVGTLYNQYVVYQNAKMPAGKILIGRKGDSPLKTGYVYCPYQPITLTPTMVDFRNFTNVKGIMTRYATKILNNRYYGKINVHGLTTYGINELR